MVNRESTKYVHSLQSILQYTSSDYRLHDEKLYDICNTIAECEFRWSLSQVLGYRFCGFLSPWCCLMMKLGFYSLKWYLCQSVIGCCLHRMPRLRSVRQRSIPLVKHMLHDERLTLRLSYDHLQCGESPTPGTAGNTGHCSPLLSEE